MKNIVFDLGGVLFARDKSKCSQDFIDFFSFIRAKEMPEFWVEYDRGTKSLDEVVTILADMHGCDEAKARDYVLRSIDLQETVKATEQLVYDLKKAGYKLYVLSNMSKEFIAFLRRFPVYALFDGEVVSCEEGTVKPEPQIFRILMERYRLNPVETLFIDDREANIQAADKLGIHGYHFNFGDPEASCAKLRDCLLM